MNQTLQGPETSDAKNASDSPGAPEYPRFARPQRIAFVQSSWHREVVEACRVAFLAEIEARHIARAQVDVFEVPGSFEIPLHAQILAKTRRYNAIVAAGLVVDTGIYRYEFISDTVIKALMDVQLRTEVPVFSAVLMPLVLSPPICLVGSISKTLAPPRAAAMAEAMPHGTPPYTTTSKEFSSAAKAFFMVKESASEAPKDVFKEAPINSRRDSWFMRIGLCLL